MPGVTATSVCLPCAPTTVTSLVPDAVVTMAATGTVSTGPSVRPVWTVTRTFSPFSAAASGLDGCTVTGMNTVEPELPELPDPEPESELLELLELLELDPESADPEEPAEPEPPPISTTAPVGVMVVAVPSSATVPVAWIPVTS